MSDDPEQEYFSEMTKQYGEAIVALKKALQRSPNNFYAHFYLAVAYALSGRNEEARTAYAEILRIDPKYSLDYMAKILPYRNHTDLKLCIDALLKAGLE